ncbi:MAG: ABC transporter ATP-binding protein [Candidatus Borkfalkiaceae bacterium]|nr:ABC transporter ATP-binding protein [Christensenellaceae bacterium]
MGVFDFLKKNKTEKEKNISSHYLTGKEVREIAKANMAEMRRLEKAKNRKAPKSEYVTEMKDDGNILEIEDLNTYFFTDQGVVKAVNGVSFNIPLNSTVGVVGESGCGKSVTSMSVMRLIQGPSGQIVSGSIRFKAYDFKTDANGKYIPVYEKDEHGNVITEKVLDKEGNVKLDKEGNPVTRPVQKKTESGLGVYEKEETVYDIAKMPIREMYRLRGRQMSMVFQEPMTSLNPVFTIGNQLDEVTLLHVPGATKGIAKKRSIEMLNMVGIAMPERVYASYPHELSGGMRQRVMIAMALAGEPRLIIADEPTTALDVTIQAQILDLFNDLKKRINGSILLITHDLGVIAEMADYVVVMYAGRIIEQGTASEIFHNPCHPYTQGLQKSKPTMKSNSDKLFNIPGNVPNPINMPSHCYFKERCSKCIKECSGDYPCMVQVSPTHFVACHLYNPKEK